MRQLYFLTLVFVLLLSGCGVQNTPIPATETAVVVTDTSIPSTNTPIPTVTSTATPPPTAIPTETSTPTPSVIGPNNFPADLNPLTGKAPSDPQLLERRPIGVKINIYPRWQYPSSYGLNLADIVYEYYHNDGSSRMHAIFYGNDSDLIGSIRSGRMMDGDLVRMYKSIFAYGRADAKIEQRLANSDFADRLIIEGGRSACPPTVEHPMCRLAQTKGDDLISSTKAIQGYYESKGLDNSRQDLSGMSFSAIVPDGGQAANQIFVRYSGDYYGRWDYDATTGRYLRYRDEAWDNTSGKNEKYSPLIDAVDKQQVATDNVVVIIARHEYYQFPPAEIVEILMSGDGTAYAFRDGQVYELKWNRPTFTSVPYLTYADGTPFPLKPGQTFFEVIGISSEISQPTADSWRFVHFIP